MKRRVLVTGSSKGIGRGIACKLAKDGFEIIVHYHSDQNGAMETKDIIEKEGGKAQLLQFDVSNCQQSKEILESDMEQNGAFYGVINNAGITRDGAFPALTEKDWVEVIQTDLNSFFNVIHPCVMPMIQLRQGGRIVVISSVSGIVGNRGQVNYSAAKSGVIGATKALALELAKRKITVNCVAPGLIDTGMLNIEPLAFDEIMKSIPLKRVGQIDEVAGLVSYLMSDIAGYVTRQVISINGGIV